MFWLYNPIEEEEKEDLDTSSFSYIPSPSSSSSLSSSSSSSSGTTTFNYDDVTLIEEEISYSMELVEPLEFLNTSSSIIDIHSSGTFTKI